MYACEFVVKLFAFIDQKHIHTSENSIRKKKCNIFCGFVVGGELKP